jgi:hypothetical protein
MIGPVPGPDSFFDERRRIQRQAPFRTLAMIVISSNGYPDFWKASSGGRAR